MLALKKKIRTKPQRSIALESVALRQKCTRAHASLAAAAPRHTQTRRGVSGGFPATRRRPILQLLRPFAHPYLASPPHAGDYSLVNSS
jgi:hypothetical protein